MALHQLLTMIPHEVAEQKRSVVARWTETPEGGLWDPEPDYGAFVDERGRVVSGNRPPRAFLDSDDPRQLLLAPDTERTLGSDVTVAFLDWGRQSVSWEEIFELWEAWDAQGMIIDCGAVSVNWSVSHRWTAPGWIAFAQKFDGSPLATVTRSQDLHPVPAAAVAHGERPTFEISRLPDPLPTQVLSPAPVPVASSFLARAKKLKGEVDPWALEAPTEGTLPMLPFTLHALKDQAFPWPRGVA